MTLPRNRSIDLGLGFLVAAFTLFLSLSPIWDYDIFWHIPIGRWILENGTLPTVDHWSSHYPPAPYQSFEWLYEVVAAWIDGKIGLEGLRWVNALFLATVFAGFYGAARGWGFTRGEALCLTMLLLLTYHPWIRIRPYVFNLAGETIVAALVMRREAPRRFFWVLAFIVSFIWAGIHSIFAFLIISTFVAAVIGGAAVEEWLGARRVSRPFLPMALAALAGWVVCPGAITSLTHLSDSPFKDIANLGEWVRWPAIPSDITATLVPHVVIALITAPLALALIVRATLRFVQLARVARAAKSPVDVPVPREIIVAASFVFFSFWAHRFFYMAVLAIALVISYERRLRSAAAHGSLQPNPRPRRWNAAMAVLSILFAAVSLLYEATYKHASLREALSARLETVDPRYFPIALTRQLVESGIEARVGAYPDYGSYVLYHGWPKLRVSIDGRLSAPDDVLAVTRRLAGTRGIPRAGVKRHEDYDRLPADILIMSKPVFLADEPTGDWIRVASSGEDEMYVRSTPETRRWIPRLRAGGER